MYSKRTKFIFNIRRDIINNINNDFDKFLNENNIDNNNRNKNENDVNNN